jgi:hypothetical protein
LEIFDGVKDAVGCTVVSKADDGSFSLFIWLEREWEAEDGGLQAEIQVR